MISGLPPARLSSLVGRARELERLSELTRRERLVTLTGPSGAGKTRLAAEVAASYGREAIFAELAQVIDADEVAQALLAGLGQAAAAPAGANRQVLAALKGTEGLLVLDNCEQVVDAVAELVLELLAAAPALRILATSQEPLAIPGEIEIRLGPLPAEDAQRLFIERVREGDPDFSPAAKERESVVAICSHLDGLPLALELAAAQARRMPVAEVHKGLDERFELLRAAGRGIPERHRSLAAAIGWSHSLLTPDEQRLFRRLAIFPAEFDRAGASAVGGADGASEAVVGQTLTRLVERSLVDFDRAVGAYRMAESLRAFGRERLAEAGEVAGTALAAAHWADARSAHQTALLLTGLALDALPPTTPPPLELLDLRAKQAERAASYAAGVAALERMRELPEVQTDPARLANIEMRLCSAISLASGDLGLARQAAERALAILRKSGDDAAALQVENEITWLRGLGGDLAGQREDALRIVTALAAKDPGGVAHLHALGSAGDACLFLGRFEEARRHLEDGLGIARQRGDAYQTGWFGGLLAHLLAFAEGPAAGRRLLDELSVEVAENRDPVFIEGSVWCHLLAGSFGGLVAEMDGLETVIGGFGVRSGFIAGAHCAAAVEAGLAGRAEALRERAEILYTSPSIFYQSRTRGWLLGRLDWAKGDSARAAEAALDAGRAIAQIGALPVAALALLDAADAGPERATDEELAAVLNQLSGPLFDGLKAYGTREGTRLLAQAGYRGLEARSLEKEGRLDEALALYSTLGMAWRRDRLLARRALAGAGPSSAAAFRLAGLVPFDSLPAAELEELSAAALRIDLEAGAHVFSPGDAADAVYVVDGGRVRLSGAGGSQVEVGAGELFGERALLAGETQAVRAVVVEAGSLIRVPAAALLEFAQARPAVLDRLLVVVRQRLRQESTLTGLPEPADVPARLLGAVQNQLIEKGERLPAFEILPVYPVAGEPWLLRPKAGGSWLVDATPGLSPNTVVQGALSAAGLQAEIVHSTSWRFQDGRLVLTYLAVAMRPTAAAGFEAAPSQRAELARGSATGAPKSIDVAQVVEHGLRHLSWLSRDDRVIAEELSPEWLAIVSGYVPEPFRAL